MDNCCDVACCCYKGTLKVSKGLYFCIAAQTAQHAFPMQLGYLCSSEEMQPMYVCSDEVYSYVSLVCFKHNKMYSFGRVSR